MPDESLVPVVHSCGALLCYLTDVPRDAVSVASLAERGSVIRLDGSRLHPGDSLPPCDGCGLDADLCGEDD